MNRNVNASRVLVYDGLCHVCTGWVRFFELHPVDPPFALIPMQSPAGRSFLAEYGIDPDDPSSFLVIDGTQAFQSSDAVIHIVAAAGGVLRLARVAHWIPRALRDGMYGLLARNRYRWFGKRTTCYLPAQRKSRPENDAYRIVGRIR
jgi:predicted DCC family thiol-disulfide oxidoreductase YuxK